MSTKWSDIVAYEFVEEAGTIVGITAERKIAGGIVVDMDSICAGLLRGAKAHAKVEELESERDGLATALNKAKAELDADKASSDIRGDNCAMWKARAEKAESELREAYSNLEAAHESISGANRACVRFAEERDTARKEMRIRLETSNRNAVEMARENIAMREDKARLDWLDSSKATVTSTLANGEWCAFCVRAENIPAGREPTLRAAIDAARAAHPESTDTEGVVS